MEDEIGFLINYPKTETSPWTGALLKEGAVPAALSRLDTQGGPGGCPVPPE